MSERRCGSCHVRFDKRRERCPACGAVWATSWRRKLVTLGIVVLCVAILYWIIVRYLLPAHGVIA